MKAVVLTKFGDPERAFEIREVDKPTCEAHQVLIKVEAFGLNFADILARTGMYPETPELPCVIGYEVVGFVEEQGSEVAENLIGKRVVGMTRFGGYAEYATTDYRAVGEIGLGYPAGKALALATQFSTAYMCARESVNLYPGERVLIHAAAGGVGIGLCQMALNAGCTVFGTAGSAEKVAFLKAMGVQHPINYCENAYEKEIAKILGNNRLDVAFNSLAGKSVKKDFKLLGYGGKLVVFGAASRTGKGSGIIAGLRLMLQTGLFTPLAFIMKSKSILGVNMLKLGDSKPLLVAKCLHAVIAEAEAGKLNPEVQKMGVIDELNLAHRRLENRDTIGKTAVFW